MKIAAFEFEGKKALGIVRDGRVTDTGLAPDLLPVLREADGLARLERVRGGSVPLDQVRLLAPLPRPGKVICVGLNYRDHCEENHLPLPKDPVLFAKFSTAIIGPGAAIVRPAITRQLDYEAELAVIIGRGGKRIPEPDAEAHVAGYTCFNDVSARDIQFPDGQWVRGKTLDTFAPAGPWVVTPDEVGGAGDLSIRCRLNGRTLQDSRTSRMIFSVPFLIAFISRAITLEPGDLIATGTPGGVGVFRQPPVFMGPGDTVEVEIERIGVLSNPVEEES